MPTHRKGVRCADSEKDADHADYVLLKSPHIRTGFAWKTFGVKHQRPFPAFYSVPSEGRFMQNIKYQPNATTPFSNISSTR